MTYIEFFNKDAVENICSCLAHSPTRVILIGDKQKLMSAHAARYKSLFAKRGHELEFICKSVNRNNLQIIVDTLSDIIENFEDCVFDLSGGEELFLVAAGIVWERYKHKKIQMHRFNIRNNSIYDCDLDGKIISDGVLPSLTVEENINIYGGTIVYDYDRPDTTYRWEMDEEFKNDIDLLWEISKKNVRKWNTQVGVLAYAQAFAFETGDPLKLLAPLAPIISHLESINAEFLVSSDMFKSLIKAGLVQSFSYDENFISVTFKNEQVKHCLLKAGLLLELLISKTALDAQEKDGSHTYSDVMSGVFIDWDGKRQEDGVDTENEIDVVMMHGMVPVFVSCKNGRFDIDELYKLNTVAERFGGKYAKKVIIISSLDDSLFSKHFLQRAADMNINVIKNIQGTSSAELSRIVRLLWCS